MSKLIRQFMKDRSGATAIEYSLIAAFIGIVLVGTLINVGGEVKNTFSDTAVGLQKRVSP